MILSLGVNLEPDTPRNTKLAVQGVVFLGTILVMALLGGPLFRNTLTELRNRRLTVEALFVLTLLGALGASIQSFILGEGPVYFEVVSVLLVVYTLGKTIGARSREQAIASTRWWAQSLSTCRWIDDDGLESAVDVQRVRPGDRIEVRPGELFTVDGTIVEGEGLVSESAVRGEPFPVVKRPGDSIYAGAASFDALFRVRATTSGTARQVDQLLRTVENARHSTVSAQHFADRLTAIFFPLIVTISVATFTYWTITGSWQSGLFHAMSVLLVACPCALGLATPIVIWTALSRLAERGVVVVSGDAVERLGSVDWVAFDKTGTLTEEQFTPTDVVVRSTLSRERVLNWLAEVQARVNHPLARPFAAFRRDVDEVKVLHVRTVTGNGVEGTIDDHGEHHVRIGRPEWIAAPKSEVRPMLGSVRGTGHRIDAEIDGELAAIVIVNERLRGSVPEALQSLRNLGIGVEVLTGDDVERAQQLDLPSPRGRLLPADKADRIEQLVNESRRPLFVGDGINDAAALARAHVGFAIASGTDVANNVADATLYNADLRVVPWSIALAREAQRIIKRNLWSAATYNLVGVSLAACGLLHPVVAAILMVVSSVFVVWSATRIGVMADRDCSTVQPTSVDKSRSIGSLAFIHACAVILQGMAIVSLLDLRGANALLVVVVFAILGALLSFVWQRWSTIPHDLDMAFGMLTIGNFGMVFGWWADHGFARLTTPGCNCAAEVLAGVWRPWMWIGMFVASNLAMLFASRRPHGHARGMYVGGNVGMGVGMAMGGWLASLYATESLATAGTMSLLGMTMGMLAGMQLGTMLLRPWIR